MESLPNEILLNILSHLSWFDRLTSFWSLNIRFNSLLCFTLSRGKNRLNNGPFATHGLPYQTCHSILHSVIFNSSSLCSSIQHIHFDGSNSNSYDLCYQWLFNDQNIVRFPNLKSLAFIRCGSIKPVIFKLSYVVEHQLNELTLTFDQHAFSRFHYLAQHYSRTFGATNRNPVDAEKERQMNMIGELLRQIFSEKCQLRYLRLDISNEYQCGPLHKSLSTNSSDSVPTHPRSNCFTLRHLDIRLNSTCFLQDVIEHVPNLEQLSVELIRSLLMHLPHEQDVETLRKSNANWFNKLPKLQCFALKTVIYEDREFADLKWLLNKVNYVEKLAVYLKGHRPVVINLDRIWQYPIDANFVRQYCLPDTIPNLNAFNFYIASASQSSSDDIEERINSFQTHSFFQSRQWTNVKCLFDPIRSCKHFFSDFPNNPFNYSLLFNWTYNARSMIPAHPSLCLLLKQFKQLSPKISSITVNRMLRRNFNQSDLRISSDILLKLQKRIDMPFRHVTRIQFGVSLTETDLCSLGSPIKRDPLREKVLARLLSLTVQLKYLHIERFEWLLHVFQYTSEELRTNALSTVQYVEFRLASCHTGSDENIHIGKHLTPLLATYMPRLQTLRLWRPDDFPWTSIRPNYKRNPYALCRWLRSLPTEQSIDQHVAVFEQDLCQLFEQLKELTFLDISGKIDCIKVDRYHSMAQTRFPDSRIDVEMSRFRLWR